MKLNYNQFLALVYADLFEYPLTYTELRRQVISGSASLQPTLRTCVGLVGTKDGYYFLKGRGKIARLRNVREKNSQKKYQIAVGVTKILTRVPTVEAIFLTGSVAVGNAKMAADIDLMVVTKSNTLWLTRFWVFGLLKSLKLLRSLKDYKDKVCPNIFLDTNHLEIKEKNLYTAHEVLQAKCLFDKGDVNYLWLKNNEWSKEYLPNAYKFRKLGELRDSDRQNYLTVRRSGVLSFLIYPIELLLFVAQYFFMKRKITNEQVDWGYAFFHPRDLSDQTVKEFERKVLRASKSFFSGS